jgi:hypothetical protein
MAADQVPFPDASNLRLLILVIASLPVLHWFLFLVLEHFARMY